MNRFEEWRTEVTKDPTFRAEYKRLQPWYDAQLAVIKWRIDHPRFKAAYERIPQALFDWIEWAWVRARMALDR